MISSGPAVQRRRLHREIVAHYAGQIVGGELLPGQVLPNEVTLAERFGLSRGVVRESLRALDERGLITVRHGTTTIVNARERWDLFDPDVITAALAGRGAEHLLNEYLECRRIIEIEAAGLAAHRVDPGGVRTLEARFAAMESALAKPVVITTAPDTAVAMKP